MFDSVLVANRGEIAVRIIRTLRRLGIHAVLVASVPDRSGLAARLADEVVLVEGYSASETYLNIEAIITAAKQTGCDAIHPGYGFLSEQARFADRCEEAGLVFVGPPAGVLRALGDKSAARQLAQAIGVPVVPGYDGPDDDASLAHAAETLGFPLMIKARGGGGGRGMREVADAAQFPDSVASARREAEAAFGDGHLLLEKLITRAHHVEVQVLADMHGGIVHLGERDCSVQRRRQKLIEESPSPVVDETLRAKLTDAALAIARAAGYTNAGTVEFLVGEPDISGERPFYFLEVNPRLQVEHPVTEMRTGLDLVELQLRIAAGEPLPFKQHEVRFDGHAIEFRINAEDPWDGFRPSSGRIAHIAAPAVTAGERVRVDWGYEHGDTVPGEYDSLLGKLVVAGASRAGSLYAAVQALEVDIAGIRTNVPLHQRVVAARDFRDGRATVDWLERWLAGEGASATDDRAWAAAAVAACIPADVPGVPIAQERCNLTRGRWIGAGRRSAWLESGGQVREVGVAISAPDSAVAVIDGAPFACRWRGGEALTITVEGCPCTVVQRVSGGSAYEVECEGVRSRFRVVPAPPLPKRTQVAAAGATAVTAPLAGTIADIRVAEGDAVEAGQLVALLEAMKMEHRIVAPAAGTVRRVAVGLRDVVREGDLLIEIGQERPQA